MCNTRITCRDCVYVEACCSFNPEIKMHQKDFLDTGLCAKQCKTFKARKDYMPREQVSTFLRNLRYVFGPLTSAQLDLLSVVESVLGRCEIPACTDEQLKAIKSSEVTNVADILQTMTHSELVDKVMHSLPQFGWDTEYPTLFGKYGKTTTGLCVEWVWCTSESITPTDRAFGKCPLEDASTQELLEMLVIEESYWSEYYQAQFKVVEYKAAKLDKFIGTCETKYLGHDHTYSEHSVDRVLEFIYAVLARDYYERK